MLLNKYWELFQCLQWPSNQWPTFFLPHFCVAGICSMQPTSPSVVFMRQLCIHLLVHSLRAACLPANCRKDDTNPVCLGLVRFGPEPVIYSADCGGCGSIHHNLTRHQSALNIDRVDFLTFESNLLHSNVPILPSLCPPSPLRLFFFGSFYLPLSSSQSFPPSAWLFERMIKNGFH